jgi:hypothetical protein
VGLVDQRSDACWLLSHYATSERRVCGLMRMAVSSYRHESKRSDEPLRTKLVELAREKPRYGSQRGECTERGSRVKPLRFAPTAARRTKNVRA